jgi:hypothetical protein
VYTRATLYERLEQSIPYSVTRLKGDPVTLIDACDDDEISVFTASGKAVRLSVGLLLRSDGRLIRLAPEDRIVAAFPISGISAILLGDDRSIRRVLSTSIVRAVALNTAGESLGSGGAPTHILPHASGERVWLITSRRTFPLSDAHLTGRAATIRLETGELLRGMFTSEAISG